jgi:hypothetical protein
MKYGIRNGISGAPVPTSLPYSNNINDAAIQTDFSPIFLYSICWHESIQGEVDGFWDDASTVISNDGGHGLAQLTSSYPTDWADPTANAQYAVTNFLLPDMAVWTEQFGVTGDILIKCVAASYNAGLAGAEEGHSQNDVDLYTTDEYGQAVLNIYYDILNTVE